MSSQGIPRRAYEFATKHWFWSAILTVTPGFLGLVFQYLGEGLGLVSESGSFTILGGIVFWCALTVCTVYALMISAAASFSQRVSENAAFVLKKLLVAANTITGRKVERYERFIRECQLPLEQYPLYKITDPEQQIETILENLQQTLTELHGLDKDQVGVSLACQCANDWQWISRVNTHGDLNALAKNQSSALHSVMVAREMSILFYPDKAAAVQDGKYVFCSQDDQHDRVGSILVHRLELHGPNSKVFAVALSISTYGKQLIEQGDEEAMAKVLQVVLKPFETRLRLELSHYYIQRVLLNRSRSTIPPSSSAPSS